MRKSVLPATVVGFGILLLSGVGTAVYAQGQQTQTPTQTQAAPQTQQPPAKHDSNTLHKWGSAIAYPFKKAGKNTAKVAQQSGKAVEYPVRKAGENTSITAHRVTGKSSVVHDKKTGQNEVVTPTTTITPAPTNNNAGNTATPTNSK